MRTREIVLKGIVVGSVPVTGDSDHDAETVRQFLEDRGLWKKVPPGNAIFGQAVAFANTAALIHDRTIKHPSKKGFNPAPFVVNSAFAIELYLKALGRMSGKALRGHDLLKLYEALPSTAKSAIELAVPPCANNRRLGEPPKFHAYLSSLRDAFVEWRYCYELERVGAVGVESTIFVMEVLHSACRSQRVA